MMQEYGSFLNWGAQNHFEIGYYQFENHSFEVPIFQDSQLKKYEEKIFQQSISDVWREDLAQRSITRHYWKKIEGKLLEICSP